jgi:hypothetical protein
MPYRFIRNGKNPANEYCNENELIDCFRFCTDCIKGRLLIFINSTLVRQITFRFKDHTVKVKKV